MLPRFPIACIALFWTLTLLTTSTTANHEQDGTYDEGVLFSWDTTQLDVLIFPPLHGRVLQHPFTELYLVGLIQSLDVNPAGEDPVHFVEGETAHLEQESSKWATVLLSNDPQQSLDEVGLANSNLRAVEDSINAWKRGIHELAPPWLAENLQIRHYVMGRDVPPLEALLDPEIIVDLENRASSNVLGLGNPSEPYCRSAIDAVNNGFLVVVRGPNGEISLSTPPSPIPLDPSLCNPVPDLCVVLEFNLLAGNNYTHVYNLNAHEFGHCLGLHHTLYPGQVNSDFHPYEDIMSYGFVQGEHEGLTCVSNLNVLGLSGVFAEALGQPGGLGYGDFVSVPVDAYRQVDCRDGT